MQQSHLNKIAEAYNKIAEGKEPCPVHEKKDEKKRHFGDTPTKGQKKKKRKSE